MRYSTNPSVCSEEGRAYRTEGALAFTLAPHSYGKVPLFSFLLRLVQDGRSPDPAGEAPSLAWNLCRMKSPLFVVTSGWFFGFLFPLLAVDLPLPDEPTLELPVPGAYQLRVLTPTVLELTLVTTKSPDPAPLERWDLVSSNGQLRLPEAQEFAVKAGNETIPVLKVGFRRRVLYAPLKTRDLRIGNFLYLQLAKPVSENQTVEVKNPRATLWPEQIHFVGRSDSLRWSPAIHVNQVGYPPGASKKAMVGYYLGSLGELEARHLEKSPLAFHLLEVNSGKSVYEGRLSARPDKGFTFSSYQEVLEADFSKFQTSGEYRLQVPGLGVSYRFFIDDGVAAAFARTYALGLYHQRCGTNNVLPFTRFIHQSCHTAPAEVPLPEAKFPVTWAVLAQKNAGDAQNTRQTAPQLTNDSTSLYPFKKRGKVDVAGGHHDAGDYSKYTINCAGLIHHLIFAVDVFPGAGELDNLGLPESGDGKGDLLQEAKWEADFLAKMQDEDGGFYFLVYPRDREYESNVTSDQGDSQVVWPKNSAATAAAVAALAQCASSPRCQKHFPDAAKLYLQKAKKGWAFLERALAKYGQDGAYQKITHYGDEFMHDDELAWAACEMFLATGEEAFQKRLLSWCHPDDPNTRKWSWWRLYDAYGCAIRSYAFAVQAGKIKPRQLDLGLRTKCEGQVIAAGEDQLRRAQDSAYGTSFPEETKRVRGAGWYFSNDAAFDLAVAAQLEYPVMNDPRPKLMEALLSNLSYEAGCNPVNISFITGLGWKRPRIIVHQNALNFRQVLPPSGIPIGNIQAGFSWLDFYQRELGQLTFPPDGSQEDPYPFYDRWGDSWNVSTEFVVLNQARSLAVTAWLMAQTPAKNQSWKFAPAHIAGLPREPAGKKELHASMAAPSLDLAPARIVWEARDQEPGFASEFKFTPTNPGPCWVEVEAQMPDGRRVFAATNLIVRPNAATK